MSRKNNTTGEQNTTPDPDDAQPHNYEYLHNNSEIEEALDVHPTTHTAATSSFEQNDEHHEAGNAMSKCTFALTTPYCAVRAKSA